jgi:hypothetical protein
LYDIIFMSCAEEVNAAIKKRSSKSVRISKINQGNLKL